MSKHSQAKWFLYATLFMAACGVERTELEQKYQAQVAEQENEADESLAGVELTSLEEQESIRSELSEDKKLRLASIESLVRRIGDDVLSCAGIGEEFAAFREKVEDLRAAGKSAQEIRVELADEHEAIKKKLEENREKFRECRDQAKQSELGLAVKSAVKSCFIRPEHKGEKRKKGFGRSGEKKGRGHDDNGDEGKGQEHPRGKMHGGIRERAEPNGMRLPPLKFENLESQECKDSVVKAEGLASVGESEESGETATSQAPSADQSTESNAVTEAAEVQ